MWTEFFRYLYENRLALEMGSLAIITAAIKSLPPPGAPFKIYDWFYDATHLLLNLADSRTPRITASPSTDESVKKT